MSNETRAKKPSNKELSQPVLIKTRSDSRPPTHAAKSRSGKISVPLSDEKYYQAFQCNPDPITITTLGEGRYVEVNDAFLEASGYAKNEVIGHTARELDIWLSHEERDYWLDTLQKQDYVYRGDEIRFKNKYGEILTFLFSTDIIDIEGLPHLLWVTKDITARKQVEEALRISEDKFSKAFNSSPVAMAISTIEEGRFVIVNRSFYRVLGYDQDEIVGQTSLDIGFWDDPADRIMIAGKIKDDQSVDNWELSFRRKNGELRQALFSADKIIVEDQGFMLGILMDITDRKKVEEEINP